MKTPGSTDIEIENRRDTIKEIKAELRSKHLPINTDSVLAELKKRGKYATYITVYRDLVHLSRENTWVRDLGESNYSERQEEIDRQLDNVAKEAWEMYDKKWTRNSTVKRSGTTSKGDFEAIEETKTEEMSGPKIDALRIIVEVQRLKMSHTNKDNIHIAAELLGRKVRELKTQNKELEKIKSKYQHLEDSEVDVVQMAQKGK